MKVRHGLSLLWRILLSTSIAATVLFALAGWMVETYARRVSERSLEEEVRTSLQAYEAVWGTRAHTLASISRIISSMSDVRAAFMTRDRATIRDTAETLWSQVSEQDAVFLVLDPTGTLIASLGGNYPDLALTGAYIRKAAEHFPRQAAGYLRRGRHLYYVVLTPVYVEAGTGSALLNVLLVAFDIDDNLASSLKTSTHGSDFAFVSDDNVIASSLPLTQARDLRSGTDMQDGVRRLRLRGADYLALETDLPDMENHPVGKAVHHPFVSWPAESIGGAPAERISHLAPYDCRGPRIDVLTRASHLGASKTPGPCRRGGDTAAL